MRLTETEYAALLTRGTVRAMPPEGPTLPYKATAPHGVPHSTSGAPEPENRFLERVRRLAREHGWATYHSYRSTRSEPGFPDLCCVREVVLFCELKSATGKLTRDQHQWLSLLAHAGCEVYCWRPRDWDAIVDRLTRKGHYADSNYPTPNPRQS
jgi:hypothetical protein